ncbi:conserved hypothetical protein [Candidatus Methylobacter favarea]|uniref:Exo-alpha-sialidase n=1 Tax=Candidatus Methylobacter favarea TaxID=2707345 RepID=A0A8S0X7N9_9GAMM|nr:sialidase family protein [Candidatus Methylobacter favarea]CAA9890247.1 conserved hypothetical protein [Candidatus Methylobacter favarea]
MINLPDFPIIKRAARITNKTRGKGFSGGFLKGGFSYPFTPWAAKAASTVLLISAVALSACSHGNQDYLKSGAADYSHYPEGGGLFVSAAFGPDGRLWRIVPEKKHVYVDYSTDLGKTFSAPVVINKESQPIKVSGENRPGIAVDGSGRITVIYAAEGAQPVALFFSVSADNGRSFSTPSPLSDKASEANSFQGRLALSLSGRAYAFWHDERDRSDWRQLGNAIYYTTIDARSGSGPVAQKLSDSVCDCCRIAAAFDSNEQPVLLARFIYPGGIRDHGLITIPTGGKEALSWRVTFDQWRIEACPEHGPAISISDGRYHIAWFTQGSVRQGLFYAYSSDQGQHFSNPLSFGNSEKLPSHPDIMAQGEHVVLTWTEFDGVKTQLMVMQSHDGGQTWLPPRAIAEATDETDFPFLLSNNQGIFVSWNSKTKGYRLLPLN